MGWDKNGNWTIDGGAGDVSKAYEAGVMAYDTNAMAADLAPKEIDWSKAWGTQDVTKITGLNKTPDKTSFFDKAFETPGATIGGIGTLVSGLGALYGAKLTKDYQNKIVKMEEDRISDNKSRQSRQQAAFDKVWN